MGSRLGRIRKSNRCQSKLKDDVTIKSPSGKLLIRMKTSYTVPESEEQLPEIINIKERGRAAVIAIVQSGIEKEIFCNANNAVKYECQETTCNMLTY